MSQTAHIDDTTKTARLEDIPGDEGMPFFGHTFWLLRDPEGFGNTMRERFGDTYRTNTFFKRSVNFFGADANQFVLMDKGQNFSSEKGWGRFLERLFPRGLMLLDFDEHKAHRHIMAAAFKTGPMKGYLERLNADMPARIAKWGKKESFHFYPAIKQLSLDMATTVFFGLEPGKQTEKVNKALTDMVSASIGLVRIPIPGTAMWAGVQGRKYMIQFLKDLIPSRRNSDASDLFTQLCKAEDENGNTFTDQEIIDHMIFLWMAAHDTITSSVTTMVYQLGKNPDWQEKLRNEISELGINDGTLPYALMNKLVLNEYAFKEALRMNPPVPGIPRETVREVEWQGHKIPAGTPIGISPTATHRDPAIWPEPNKFDPMRFSPEGGVKERHKFAWVPFGGGAHMCVGLHFAYMQAKVIMTHLLPNYEIVLADDYTTEFQVMPLMKPVDGLPVKLKAIK